MNTTNKHLVELEQGLESTLLEAFGELELGDMDKEMSDSLGERSAEAIEEIRLLAQEANADLKAVQARLGELNYILAEDEMNDLKIFDRYRDRILNALQAANDDLSKLQLTSATWSRLEEDQGGEWHRLSARLRAVRDQIANGSAVTADGFKSERMELSNQLESAGGQRRKPPSRLAMGTRLRQEIDGIMPGIKTMFMYAEQPDQGQDNEGRS